MDNRILRLGLLISLSLWLISCEELRPSKPKADNPKQSSTHPHNPYMDMSPEELLENKPGARAGRYQLFFVETKTGGQSKTLIFRIDSANGTTWKLDPEFSKWVLIEGGAPNDPLGIRENAKGKAAVTPEEKERRLKELGFK